MNTEWIPVVPLLALVEVINISVSPALTHHSRARIYDIDVQFDFEKDAAKWRWTNTMESIR